MVDFKSVRQSQEECEHLQFHSTQGSNIHKKSETTQTVYINFSGKAVTVKFVPGLSESVDYYA
jgi:hypothetical protein